MERTVYVQMTRAELMRKLNRIPHLAMDSEQVLSRVGSAAFDRVYNAFIVKSQGGTDEAGDRWQPLSATTVQKRLRKKLKTEERDRPSSALTTSQRAMWWSYYRQALRWTKEKDTAAKIAWSKLKRKGAYGHYDKYGPSSVLILRDTEQLLTSLHHGSGSAKQVFRTGLGYVELGTTRKGATAHHLGIRVPRRRLWPNPSTWPSAWWQDLLDQLREGIVQVLVEELR